MQLQPCSVGSAAVPTTVVFYGKLALLCWRQQALCVLAGGILRHPGSIHSVCVDTWQEAGAWALSVCRDVACKVSRGAAGRTAYYARHA